MLSLTAQEQQKYRHDGFVVPNFQFSSERVDALRSYLDELITKNPDTRPEHLVNAHIDRTNAEGVSGVKAFLDLAHDDEVLDLVESVLGPDIVLWGCHAFCKPAGDGMEVPWHQDGQYWPIRPLANCTVWIALDSSTSENGCLRVVSGSHREQKIFKHHRDSRDRLTLTEAVDRSYVDPNKIVDIELEPGQLSMHDVYMIHGSNENRSQHRRAGLALRYMPATSVFEREVMTPSDDAGFAVDFTRRPIWLVRGQDTSTRNNFTIGH